MKGKMNHELLAEIEGFLDSIENNAANAALAKSVKEYEVCIKIVVDCKEAVLSLFQKLDQEYWELREQFEQAQREIEYWKKIFENDRKGYRENRRNLWKQLQEAQEKIERIKECIAKKQYTTDRYDCVVSVEDLEEVLEGEK